MKSYIFREVPSAEAGTHLLINVAQHIFEGVPLKPFSAHGDGKEGMGGREGKLFHSRTYLIFHDFAFDSTQQFKEV